MSQGYGASSRLFEYPRLSCRQGGQVLPLGLVLLLFGVLISLALFNTGQLASEKVRITNAADAAAYSGLLWQARALNFQAYTNRAMVANQVSIAQAVSLRSWAQYGRIGSNNMNAVLGSLPFVGPVSNAFKTAVEASATVIEPVAEAMLFTADAVNGALSAGQEIMYRAGALATPEVMRNIAKANDPNFQVASAFTVSGLMQNGTQWRDFTDRYGTGSDAMVSRAQMINDSRDGFSRSRDWDLLPFWFFSTPLTRHNVIRRGETRLIYVEPVETEDSQGNRSSSAGHWEWKAKDSVSLQTKVWRILGTKRIEVPIGWAQSYANNDPTTESSIEPCEAVEENVWPPDDGCPKWLGMNKLAEQLASEGIAGLGGNPSNTSSINLSRFYNGLRPFRDLAGFPDQKKDPRLELRVEVFTDKGNTPTTESGPLATRKPLNLAVNTAKNEIAAVAKGELYFKRPELRTTGGYVEYANGYNPFWDVRLKALDPRERLAAILLRAEGMLVSNQASSVPSAIGPGLAIGSLLDGANSPVAATEAASTSATSATAGVLRGYEEFLADSDTVAQLNPDAVREIRNVTNHFLSPGQLGPSLIGDAQTWVGREFQLDASVLENPFAIAGLMEADVLVEGLADELTDQFQNRVEDVIRESAHRLMSSAMAGGLSGVPGLGGAFTRLEDGFSSAIGGLQSTRDMVENILHDVSSFSETHRVEIERVRNAVDQEFSLARLQLEGEINQELSLLQESVDIFSDLLDPDFAGLSDLIDEALPEFVVVRLEELGVEALEDLSEEAREILNREIETLVAEQVSVSGSRLEREAERLVEIINQQTQLFSVPQETAQRVIELMDLLDDPVDPLSVTDLGG